MTFIKSPTCVLKHLPTGGRTYAVLPSIFFIIMLIAGCQSLPQGLWHVTIKKDEFTDQVTKMATAGSDYVGGYNIRFFRLFVAAQNNKTFVGVRCAGRFGIPTGTVQIRVDDNPSWTISPSETPVELSPAVPKSPSIQATAQSGVYMTNMTQILSPFTAVSGEKANQILAQMVHGRVVRFRTIGMNQAASTTGEAKIDGSFFSALREIGVSTNFPQASL